MKTNPELAFSTLQQGLDLFAAVVAETPVGELGDSGAQDRLEKLIMRAVSVFHKHENLVSRIAGKIAAQSDPELGLRSMSNAYGHRTPASLIADLCKTSYQEAARLVQNGTLLEQSWRENSTNNREPLTNEVIEIGKVPVAHALEDGVITPAQANEISKALDKTKNLLNDEEQERLADTLLEVGEDLSVSSLKNFAEKKVLSVTAPTPQELERQIRERRYLAIRKIENGLYPIHGLLDPESAAIIKAVFDDASNPNRISTVVSATADPGSIIGDVEKTTGVIDSRSTGQRHLDRLIDLLHAGIAVNPKQIYTGAKPAVKVIVRAEELDKPTGKAWLEGIDVPVSKQTAERIICTSGAQTVITDLQGIPLYLGREARTFTPAQKQALTVRDGGCLWPECDRPPSWCEAHHILEWEQGGHTNLDNGILLCRKHHMDLHNYGWKITAKPEPPPGFRPASFGDTQLSESDPPELFTLHPPPDHPWYQEAMPMTSKAQWHREPLFSG